MFEKVYELPISRDYVRHWGIPEAVRELLQNAIDSDSPLEYQIGKDSIKIISRHARLEPRTLLLGKTSKADAPDKIGSFGEGYKIALLVLTREGCDPKIHNDGTLWTPEFRHSRQFNDEILCVIEGRDEAIQGRGLTFDVNNLNSEEIEKIKQMCLHMQDDVGEHIDTYKGRILFNRQGKLYVSGLFVCDIEANYGYDVKPEFLRLERDRNTVGSFNLHMLTRDMWFSTNRTDMIAKMIADKAPDMSYAHWGTPEIVKEACFEHFKREYPGHILANSKQELDELVKRGMTKTVFLGGGPYTEIVRSSTSYKSQVLVHARTPLQFVEDWLAENKPAMQRNRINFQALLNEARKWRAA